jgi:hypothetical protein
MTQAATVTAEDLVRALKRRKAALPAEIGSFVVLEACDALLHASPARLTASEVLISEDGYVQLAPAPSCPEVEATQALHQLLAFMLVAAGPAPLPALMRLLEKGPSSGRWTLASLRDDLEASLVPLNRHASRRVLSRFVREIGWAERRPAKKPTFQDLDSELSSFLSEEPRARAPLVIGPEPEPEDTQEDLAEEVEAVQEQVRFFESARPAPQVSGGKTLVDVVPSGASSMIEPRSNSGNFRSEEPGLRELAHEPSERNSRAPSLRPLPRASRAPSEIPRAPHSPALIWGGILLALSVAIVIATLQLRPELLGRLSHGDPEPERKEPVVVVKRPAAGDLVVRVATERAQILRFVGRGPVTVPHLPLGVAHEFVGVSDTASPARLLVPKDAEWEGTPDGPRYEAAMQLGNGGAPGSSDLGETLLPQDVGTPSEKLGSVRIVTTPRGAKVYQVIGFAPEARIEALPLESTQELLIYRKGFAPELRVVAPSDYLDRDGKKVAELDVTLAPVAKAAATKR